MKKVWMALIAIALMPLTAQAAVVAVTDSGTDFQHEALKGHAWVNVNEKPDNMVDDDNNGKVDDVVGWNFVDNYGKIFFREHLNYIQPITFKLFTVIAKQQAGTATEEDKKFWAVHVTSLNEQQKKDLLAHLNYYGQYAHSTHVSGIIAAQSPQSKMMSLRVFADAPPAEYEHSGATKGLADWAYKLMAALTNGVFDSVGAYLGETHADVANFSLGVSLQNMAKLVLSIRGIKDPTAEQLSTETKRVAAQFEPKGRKWMSASPKTLFVIAAGNDGTNNDILPVFPAIVRVDNAITVAATLENSSLAKFSNYGKSGVDIAAPGVAVMSSVPSLDSKQMLPMSGTSMAAPYITGVAAQMKELNPALQPKDIKMILMGTVDHKEWLKEKVISGGVVNSKRAYTAAESAKTMTLTEAIAQARTNVADEAERQQPASKEEMKSPQDLQVFANELVF